MHSDTLEAIKQSAAIPSMPMIATRCYEMTSDPNCNYDRLIELLNTDAGMAVDVLRLSNSALFGATRQIVSLKQAVTLLGLRRVRDLVLSRYLVQKMNDVRSNLIDINHFWRRSLATGILAARFAEAAKARGREEAFMAGLLADVGVVILSKALPRQYGLITMQYRTADARLWIDLESAQVGVDHTEISALVLEQWNLPATIVDAVRHHHDTCGADASDGAAASRTPAAMPSNKAPVSEIAPIIGAAGEVARWLCAAATPEVAAQGCIDALSHVGLEAGMLGTALAAMDEDIQNMSRLLGVDVVDAKTYKAVAEHLASTTPALSAR